MWDDDSDDVSNKDEINAVDDNADNRESNVDFIRKKTRPTAARLVSGRRMRLKRGLTMDSGASANVMPRRMALFQKKIRPSPGSKRGVKYVAADDGIITNEGEYDMHFETKEG